MLLIGYHIFIFESYLIISTFFPFSSGVRSFLSRIKYYFNSSDLKRAGTSFPNKSSKASIEDIISRVMR